MGTARRGSLDDLGPGERLLEQVEPGDGGGGRVGEVVDVDEVAPRHHQAGPIGPRELGDV